MMEQFFEIFVSLYLAFGIVILGSAFIALVILIIGGILKAVEISKEDV